MPICYRPVRIPILDREYPYGTTGLSLGVSSYGETLCVVWIVTRKVSNGGPEGDVKGMEMRC
jgi:hypothetical protein